MSLNQSIVDELSQNVVDFHCHGVGRFDFTEIKDLNLDEIEVILAHKKQYSILTLYLPKPSFTDFLVLMEKFHQGKIQNRFKHIKGIGLEGPLLASHGGTPEKGVWLPDEQHWRQIAACGEKGLIYVILSPDIELTNNPLLKAELPYSINIQEICHILLADGVLPAPGHFMKHAPELSAQRLQALFDIVAKWGRGQTITDHLFNDMPKNFKHAWRTPEEKIQREEELTAINLESWHMKNLNEKLGPVPATMIKNAIRGTVKICQNFDGEHVDLAIVKKAVALIGAENLLLMTDSIESKRLAGRDLYQNKNSGLLYQSEGVVAAGSTPVSMQVANMLKIGLSQEQIQLITQQVPELIFKQHEQNTKKLSHVEASYI